jgi:uncharacterized protein (TIGR03382 family)
MQSRIMTVSAAGELVPSDLLIWRSGDLRGNNNNNEKGGYYLRSQMGVIRATATGMTYEMPLTDVSDINSSTGGLVGLDGTHLGMSFGLFGTTNALVPGVVFLGGSHTGGGAPAQARIVTYDATLKKFADAAMVQVATHDRHLYSNYLGNNPGNQGRNHSQVQMVANPFVGTAGNTDAYLMVFATTGKNAQLMMDPKRKLSAFLSVLPIAQTPKAVVGTTPDDPTTPTEPTTPDDPATPDIDESEGDESGVALGGCSTSGSTGGLMTFLLIGLAAFGIRRRR